MGLGLLLSIYVRSAVEQWQGLRGGVVRVCHEEKQISENPHTNGDHSRNPPRHSRNALPQPNKQGPSLGFTCLVLANCGPRHIESDL